MSTIMQIDELYDSYHEIQFGCVGRDMETGEIKYYSYNDLQGDYQNWNHDFQYLREFNPENEKERKLARLVSL